jgi:hypothetical protein
MVIYRCLPITAPGGMDTQAVQYGAVFFLTGLLISWYGPCPSTLSFVSCSQNSLQQPYILYPKTPCSLSC